LPAPSALSVPSRRLTSIQPLASSRGRQDGVGISSRTCAARQLLPTWSLRLLECCTLRSEKTRSPPFRARRARPPNAFSCSTPRPRGCARAFVDQHTPGFRRPEHGRGGPSRYVPAAIDDLASRNQPPAQTPCAKRCPSARVALRGSRSQRRRPLSAVGHPRPFSNPVRLAHAVGPIPMKTFRLAPFVVRPSAISVARPRAPAGPDALIQAA